MWKPFSRYPAAELFVAACLCAGLWLGVRRAAYGNKLGSRTSRSTHPVFFFVETSARRDLNARQACSIESAALHHPSIAIKLLMTGRPRDSSPFMHTLRQIRNVRVARILPHSAFAGTPLESWYKSSTRLQSPYAVAHLSDALRLLLLWRYGGLYADTDVIVQRSMLDLRNALGKQDEYNLGNGVLVFDKEHPLLFEAMDVFSKTYNPLVWDGNGPKLLERILKNHCSQFLGSKGSESCGDVSALPKEAFYAVPYGSWEKFFNSEHRTEVLRRTNNSFLIHFWNMLSAKTPVYIGKGSAYEDAARKNCPSVYEVVRKVGQF